MAPDLSEKAQRRRRWEPPCSLTVPTDQGGYVLLTNMPHGHADDLHPAMQHLSPRTPEPIVHPIAHQREMRSGTDPHIGLEPQRAPLRSLPVIEGQPLRAPLRQARPALIGRAVNDGVRHLRPLASRIAAAQARDESVSRLRRAHFRSDTQLAQVTCSQWGCVRLRLSCPPHTRMMAAPRPPFTAL